MSRAVGSGRGVSGASAGITVTAGDRLVEQISQALPVAPDGMTAEWSEIELSLIDLARAQMNEVEQLEAVLAADGPTVAGSKGQMRLHPAFAELRLARLALTRILSELRLPDQGPLKNATKQRAANVRWARERKRDGEV